MTTSLETRFCWDGCKRNSSVFTTATGTKVCTYCGEKFPAEFPRADIDKVNETRMNYLQGRIAQLESNVGLLQDKVRALYRRLEVVERP